MEPLAELIRRCRIKPPEGPTDATAWEALLAHVTDMIQGCRRYHGVNGFKEWIIGWLFFPRRLDAICQRIWLERPLPEQAQEREAHAQNYLHMIIMTGFRRFLREHSLSPLLNLEVDPNQVLTRVDPLQLIAQGADEVRAAATRLDQKIRIPFWLHNIRICRDLLSEDLEYLNRVRGEDVAAIINGHYAAALANGNLWPIGAALISRLMEEPPIGVNAVYQRVHYALVHIQGEVG